MDRALPGHMVDLIHNGASFTDRSQRGDRATFKALFRTAASASQRGWTYAEWASLVMDPRHELGRQAQLTSGKPRGNLDNLSLIHI